MNRDRRLVLALWVLALDGVLLVPLASRLRSLERDWAQWRTAEAVVALRPDRKRPGDARP